MAEVARRSAARMPFKAVMIVPTQPLNKDGGLVTPVQRPGSTLLTWSPTEFLGCCPSCKSPLAEITRAFMDIDVGEVPEDLDAPPGSTMTMTVPIGQRIVLAPGLVNAPTRTRWGHRWYRMAKRHASRRRLEVHPPLDVECPQCGTFVYFLATDYGGYAGISHDERRAVLLDAIRQEKALDERKRRNAQNVRAR